MKILIKESQLKSFIKNKLGVDLTDRINIVTNKWELPMEFDKVISPRGLNEYLNKYGPMFAIETKNNLYLTQDRGRDIGWFTVDKYDRIVDDFEVMTNLGVGKLGLSMNDLISMYF
jgi:hypothetical protein